ncbi:hypothetical protein MBLNU457_7655t1 [Dothideomycetes sp. NU457]
MASSPFRPGTTVEDQLSFYKAQYEQIELELQEFQASSKDLEAELEKDVEASEKRERKLKEQVEKLGFEVDEWKTKYKQSKDEANRAQTSLQKEITTLRESTRTLQLKLRDIEVANDNYEMQARNTTSSLEDLESKYNVAIERGVMIEEEIRAGEQEREQLRIETQRLRDELSDLRVESEITNDKLRRAESTIEGLHSRKPQAMHLNPARPRSIASEVSAVTPPSPSISTPPPSKSDGSGSDLPTPPSPPLSEATTTAKPPIRSNGFSGRKSLLSDSSVTPRPSMTSNRVPRHSRGPSLSATGPTLSSSQKMGPPPPRPSNGAEALPRSGSLYQIKGLIGRMQKIEERVHSVRSKLPPLSRNSPRNSPRAATATDNHVNVPSSVTVRRRSIKPTNEEEGGKNSGRSTPRLPRMSFGVPERPASAMSRPSSRTSNAAADPFVRPSSRISMGGVSSKSYAGTHARHGYAPSTSGTHSPEKVPVTPTARRTTIDKTSIPTPSSHRQSGGVSNGVTSGRRTSMGLDKRHNESMPPPHERARKLSEVGETF